MTKEQLDAIRNNVSYDDVSIHDVIPLLEEVQRLQEENTLLLEANEGEPWAWQVLVKQRDTAFQRGVNAAADELGRLLTKRKATAIWVGPDELRALPDPEDK